MNDFLEKNKRINIFSCILFIIGLIPSVLNIFTERPNYNGYNDYKYILDEKLITAIPYFNELIFYICTALIFISLTYSFIEKNLAKRIIFCEIFVVLSMYLGDIMNNSLVILVLTIPNFICFYVIYKFSKNIKISYLPSITGALAVLLYLCSNEISIIIHHGYNSGFGIEGFSRAVGTIAFVNLLPAFITATVIRIVEDIRSEKENLI